MNQLISTPAIYLHDTDAFVNAAVAEGLATTVTDSLGQTHTLLRPTHPDIILTVTDASGSTVATLTAANNGGTFTFYDAEQAVRDHMLANSLALAPYTFDFLQRTGMGHHSTVVGQHTAVALILFRENRYGSMTADDRLRSQFLTAAPVTMLCKNGLAGVARFHFHANIATEGEDDELQFFQRFDFAGSTPYISDICYIEEQRLPSGVFEWHSVQVGVPPYSRITLTCGSRKQDIYLVTGGDILRLRFLNRYNLPEQQHLPAALTHTPSTEKDWAVFGEERQDYAVGHTDEFTLLSDPLPAQLHPALMDFVRSRKPEVWLEETWREVVVTGYELERSDAPAATIRLSATFQLRDRRRRID